ncbi:MAG: hypothetical protein ACKO13_04000, partial [Cytophagales bacterium]
FQYEISSNPIVWKRGEEVSIVYDPANPTYAKVVSFWSLYRWSIILAIIATPLILLSIGYFVFIQF